MKVAQRCLHLQADLFRDQFKARQFERERLRKSSETVS